MKQFSFNLIKKKTARFRVGLNNEENPAIPECYIFDNFNNLTRGCGIGKFPKLKVKDIGTFLNKDAKISKE